MELRFLVAMRVIVSVPARMDWVLRSVSRASRWGSQVGLVQHWMQADWRQSDNDHDGVLCDFKIQESVGEESCSK